jgi:hypothetical protein
MPAPVRKQTSKRSDQGTIGRPKLRTLMLARQHRQLVPQHHQFNVLGELSPPTPNEQLQNSREHEVSEGEEHRPIPPANSELDTLTATAVLGTPFGGFWYSRARVIHKGETYEVRRTEQAERARAVTRLVAGGVKGAKPRFEPGIGVLTPFTV